MDLHENAFQTQLPQEEAHQPTWTGLDVFLIGLTAILILVAGSFGAALLLRAYEPGQSPGQPNSVVFSVALTALEGFALIGSVYLVGLRRRNYGWEAVGLRPFSRAWLLAALALGGIFIPLAGFIAEAIQTALGLPLENPQLPFLAPSGFSWFGFIGLVLFGGIVAPFAEELIFRGVLYQWLRDRWGFWIGAVVSALVFGASHGDIAVGGAAAVLGFVLAWVYERSHSLWPSVLIHIINNSVKIIILYYLLATGNVPPGGF